MTNPTLLDRAGILYLERVLEFFKKMKIPIEDVDIKSNYFELQPENHPDVKRKDSKSLIFRTKIQINDNF